MGVLPPSLGRAYGKLEPYGLIVVFALLVILPWLLPDLRLLERVILPPVQWMGSQLAALATAVAGPEPM